MIAKSTSASAESSVCDERSICIFTAAVSVSNGFLEPHMTVVVHFSRSVIALRQERAIIEMKASQVIVQPQGQTDVLFQYALGEWSACYSFTSELEAVTFVGAIRLVQHLAVLQTPEAYSPASDALLSQFTKYALDYAEELWSLLLWQKSYKFHDFVDVLNGILSDFNTKGADMTSVVGKFTDLCTRFAAEVSVEEKVELDGVTHYTMTPEAVLLAQTWILQQHATCIQASRF
ncbi:hypothetical protein Ae201684P_007763 [Aphanomyces euteiches]|uniref:Uncharacterized protein n=1 Tax=Aphanomyces euteiches TaxID=100861 RepID=A0A6G0W489_9STRA|nr:hypothetical protein Ae201684_018901 [Aphanomyces euteiches]KAH9089595.1 hypothetical protein Ae201684P_007763 [Aphanomyces euteiches]